MKREKEVKAVPPPINRAEKPLIQSKNHYNTSPGHAVEGKRPMAQESSPFSSPPSSSASADEEMPPSLPSRPRPQTELASREKTFSVGFEPPPLHHSVVTKRKEKEYDVSGISKGQITPQLTGEQRPALPMRPPTIVGGSLQPSAAVSTMQPPPRPPRPALTTLGLDSIQPKRVVSTPTTQHPPPPSRSHGRSMTVDRTSERAPAEFRQPVAATLSSTASGQGSPPKLESSGPAAAYPDSSNTNRRLPYIKQGVHEISTKYDARILAVCGEYACTSGQFTRVWNVNDGELLMSLSHGEGVKATSVAFKPGADVQEEGTRLWIGNNCGEIMEVDIATQTVISSKPNVHGRNEVMRIFRCINELWTLDDGGALLVWGPDETGIPSLTSNPHQTFRLPRGHTFSMVVGDELWHATGKEIRVFKPTTNGQEQFQVLVRPLMQDNAGEVTSGTQIRTQLGKVYFGHIDGKVSIYAADNYSCLGVFGLSSYKINSLTGAGRYLWAGFNTGRVCVYDIDQSLWTMKKDFQAHDNPVVKLIADAASPHRIDRLQVISLGADNMLKAWDGLLQDDWLETEMKLQDANYCQFEQLKALIMTWNAGASTPHSLRYSESDAAFMQHLLQNSDSPDILVFGFQELVDLEDKTATASEQPSPRAGGGSPLHKAFAVPSR
jgi:hypothetical protein